GLDKNLNFASYQQDSERIDSISRVFPLTFFLVAALVSFTGMFRIVEDDRSTIAAMQSLGYGPGAVFGKYFFYSLSVGIPGIILGIAIGYWLFPSSIFNYGYSIMYLLPSIETPLHLRFCILASVIAIVSVAAPTLMVTTANMRENPASLMRPKAPPPGKRIALEKIKTLWSAMNFSAKVTARNILRYKKRFFMTVAGIAGCTAIVLTGFGVRDSIKFVPVNQFDRVLFHAFQITLSDSARRTDRLALERYLIAQDDVRELGHQYRENVDVGVSGKTKTYRAALVVPAEPDLLPDFVRLADPRSGAPVAPTSGAVIISQKLSSLLGISTGDILTMTGDDDIEYALQIRGITENYVQHYIYMTPEYYRSLTGVPPDYNTIVCLAGELAETRRDELSWHILDNAGVSALSFKEKTRDFYADILDSLNVIVLILIVSGALLAFVVLFSLTGINIDERKREIASLKVLGFYDGEASAYIFRENTVNTVVGVIVGLVFGVALHQFVIRTAEVDMILFGKVVAPISYVYSSALTFFYTFIVNTVMTSSIRNIDMIESLKSVE
ncbi:MAG: ABC transporter permease, partial [Peptococcaceae bacterium]|nr:ABC transporter permease [Peptococcaceae bacterium]